MPPKASLKYQLFQAVNIDKEKQSVKIQEAPIIKPTDKGKFQITRKYGVVQADLIYMFFDPDETDGNKIYKYCLTVVDVATGSMDAEPLHDRTADDVIEGFETIFKRKYISKDIMVLVTDQGSEFKNAKFKEYMKDNQIEWRYTMTNRHQQTAPVEMMNHKITQTIYTKKTSDEIESGEPVYDWIELLPRIVEVLNDPANLKKIKIADFFKPPRTTNKLLDDRLSVGDVVHVKLQQPRDSLTNKKMHGGFRNGDVRFEQEVTRINNVLILPNQPIRYKVDKYDNVTFIRKELLLSTNEAKAKHNEQNPIKEKAEKPVINVSEHKGPITRQMAKKNILL